MADQSVLQIYRCENTHVMRVVGRGTLRESPLASDYVKRVLSDNGTQVIMDLANCTFLDSTFLGCLIGLHKSNDPEAPARFSLYTELQQRTTLFSTTMLHRLFHFVESCPSPQDQPHLVEPSQLKPHELGEHIMSCHQRLADAGGDQASAYQSVADRLARELRRQINH